MVLERCLVLFIRAASEVYSRSLRGSNLHGIPDAGPRELVNFTVKSAKKLVT